MAEQRLAPAGENGSRGSVDGGWGKVADGIHPLVEADQLAAGDSSIDGIVAQAAGPQLRTGREAMLATGQSRDSAINLAHCQGNDKKAAISADIST